MIRTIPPKCACGCGMPVKWAYWNKTWNKYIKGHKQTQTGWRHSEETKQKIKSTNIERNKSEDSKNKKIAAWKNEERREKQSKRLKELWNDAEYRSKMTKIRQQYKDRPEYIEKQKQKRHSEETKAKMSMASKAMWTDAYKKTYSKTHRGNRNTNWKGGLSFLPYSTVFTKELKNRIKERDNFTCQNTNCTKFNNQLCVHHIDYNKQNCDESNLITLCVSCNVQANGNRLYWKEFYQKIMYDKKYQNTEFSIS